MAPGENPHGHAFYLPVKRAIQLKKLVCSCNLNHYGPTRSCALRRKNRKKKTKNELPSVYKRYVDDTFTIMPDLNEANIFLDKLNSCHRNLKFNMEIADQNTMCQYFVICIFSLCYSCLLGILLHISLIIDLIMTLSELRNVVAFLNF